MNITNRAIVGVWRNRLAHSAYNGKVNGSSPFTPIYSRGLEAIILGFGPSDTRSSRVGRV